MQRSAQLPSPPLGPAGHRARGRARLNTLHPAILGSPLSPLAVAGTDGRPQQAVGGGGGGALMDARVVPERRFVPLHVRPRPPSVNLAVGICRYVKKWVLYL